jgi:glyoxylase-like metal-dependent hydrolase (beta-lactamase superfamily II)/rhodanese-related sulfurtransferase
MYFKQILNEEAGCSSYVIASRQSREALVVDPALDIGQYVDLARARDFTIKLVIDTHIHADHVSGARKLAATTGAEHALHESADVLFPFRGLKDGERIHLGQLLIDVWHTPGHRPEAISLVVTNPPRGEEPSFVLTGDCLFVGDVGRPDFGGLEGARQQYESVQRLMRLNDFVAVFPAHFEGSCGKGMCGRPNTTIGFERRYNPMLQLDREAFIASASDTPARPLNMTAIVATNRGEASYEFAEPRTVGDLQHVAVDRAPAWLKEREVTVLDVREPDEYAAGHLPGALSIPQSELALHLEGLDKSKPYLVVCAGGVRSLRATHYLAAAGYDATTLDGGTAAWVEAGFPVDGDHSEPILEEVRYQHAAPMTEAGIPGA